MTEGLKQSQHTQKRLFKIANKNPNGDDKIQIIQTQNQGKHSKTRRQAKRSNFNKKFKEIKHNAKEKKHGVS